jgi:hypothetical protein
MPFAYIVHKGLYVVVSTGLDRVSWTEIRACQDQTKTDPNFNPEFDQIVDLRATTSFDMTGEQATVLARRMIFSFSSKRAFFGIQSRRLRNGANVGSIHRTLRQSVAD